MTRITLHTAVADNGGRRRDAGAVVTVGRKPDQILRAEADRLVGTGLAARMPRA